MLWEDKEIESLVFDKRSLAVLVRIIKKGILDNIIGKISEGKEAAVFLATKNKEYRAIKIYKPETSKFFNSRNKYLNTKYSGDFELACKYAKKEYKNMNFLYGKINMPEPIYLEKNILVMSFLGENGIPYPQLYKLKITPQIKNEIINIMDKLIEANYVHGDLSPYNILVGDKVYLIDFGQATTFNNPKAMELFKRDLANLAKILGEDVIKRWEKS